MSEPTRRDWMRIVGVGAAGGAVGAALGCGDNVAIGDLGAAVLEPSSDALLVSVWARAAREVTIEVRAGDTVMTAAVPIGPSGTGTLDLRGLAPGTPHEITVSAGQLRLPPCYASTAPRDDDPRPIRIAIAADVDTSPEFDTDLAGHLVDARPDLLVSIGDFPYTDNGPPAMDEDTYRERHAALRTLPQRARAARGDAGARDLRRPRVPQRLGRALRRRRGRALRGRDAVWDEFFPLRDATGEVRYRSWRWGANVECFLLDCRRFRSANGDPDGPAKTMLGAAQRAWFTGAIARSTATFKLVFTSVPLDFGAGDDHWAAFRTERQAIFDAVVGIRGVVFVSADQHWFASHRHAGGLREFQVGPFARGIATPPPAVPGVLFRALAYNAGLIDIDGDRIAIAGLGPDGARFFEETLTADELTPLPV